MPPARAVQHPLMGGAGSAVPVVAAVLVAAAEIIPAVVATFPTTVIAPTIAVVAAPVVVAPAVSLTPPPVGVVTAEPRFVIPRVPPPALVLPTVPAPTPVIVELGVAVVTLVPALLTVRTPVTVPAAFALVAPVLMVPPAGQRLRGRFRNRRRCPVDGRRLGRCGRRAGGGHTDRCDRGRGEQRPRDPGHLLHWSPSVESGPAARDPDDGRPTGVDQGGMSSSRANTIS